MNQTKPNRILDRLRQGDLVSDDWRDVVASRRSLAVGIHKLRQRGYQIESVLLPRGDAVSRVAYRLVGEPGDKPKPPKRPVTYFIDLAASVAGLKPDDLTAKSKIALFMRPRRIACHFARAEGWAFDEIAKHIRRNRVSVLNLCYGVPRSLASDPLFRRLYERTERAVNENRPPVPVPVSRSRPRPVATRLEIGDDLEIHAVPKVKPLVPDPLLAALRVAHPERFAA